MNLTAKAKICKEIDMKGKDKCKALKQIRQMIADENDIEYVTRECTYQGECKGTCPKCEAELRYLEKQLEKKQALGKKVAIAGISAGMTATLCACDPADTVQNVAWAAKDTVDDIKYTIKDALNLNDGLDYAGGLDYYDPTGQDMGDISAPPDVVDGDMIDPDTLLEGEPVAPDYPDLDGDIEYFPDNAEELIERFLDGVYQVRDLNGGSYSYSDFNWDEDDPEALRVGELKDVDNDGEVEQIILDENGGFYLDYNISPDYDFELRMFPSGDNLYFGKLSYLDREDGTWLCFSDTGDSDHEYLRFIKMAGTEIETDMFLKAYSDEEGKEVKYYLDDTEIPEEEYLALRADFMGY